MKLYWRIVKKDPTLPKNILLYFESWEKMDENVLRMRKRAGKRTPPKRRPPYFMKIRFVENSKLIHGSDGAPAIVDFSRGELRIPCAGIRIPLTPSLLRELKGELTLAPKPEFILMLTCRGKLRIIARRCPPHWWVAVREECSDYTDVRFPRPLVGVGVDVNSRYGVTLVAFEIGDSVRMLCSERWRPPRKWLRLIKLLQNYSDKPDQEKLRKLQELLPQRLKLWLEGHLTTERAERLYRLLYKHYRKKVMQWERELLHRLRTLIRGRNAIIALEVPNAHSLEGSPLQDTLLRITHRIENLAKYEGAFVKRVRVSGAPCPLCGGWGIEVKHRYYRCKSCGLVCDRDYSASFKAIIVAAPELAAELRGWLRSHPRALAPNYGNNGPCPTPLGPQSLDTLGESSGRSGSPRAR